MAQAASSEDLERIEPKVENADGELEPEESEVKPRHLGTCRV